MLDGVFYLNMIRFLHISWNRVEFWEFELYQFNDSTRKHAISFSLLVKFSLTTLVESDQISRTAYCQALLIPQLVSEIYIIRISKWLNSWPTHFHLFVIQITLQGQKNVILHLLFVDWIREPMRYLQEAGSVYYAPTVCDNCIYTSYRIFSCIYDIPISSQHFLRMPWTVLLLGRT